MAKHPASKNIPKDTNAGDLLLQGSILAIAGILVRFIGLLYKVPMIRILGQEGIGYYNTAYEIYNIGLILSSYSLPLAMSKLIAARRVRRQYQDIRRVFFSGLTVSAAAGGLMTLLLLLGGDFITMVIFKSPSSALPLKVMAPTIFVFSIMGVIRGYFQGQGNMVPTSVSQIIEQVVHAAVSIAASYAFMVWFASRPNPKSYGAAGGTLGTLCGAVAALIYLAIRMLCFQRRNARTLRRPQKIPVETWGNVYSALFLTLTPIILSQFVYQLSGSVDNSMFGQIMDAKGLTETQRATLLGVYGGEYRLLSNVPVAIASSLGASMIPSIVQSRTCHRLKEVRYKIRMTIKFNMLIAIPCAVGMGVLAGPIMELIFHDNSELSANLMRIGAPAVVFFSLSTVTNAVLQGIDRMSKSVSHSAISLVLHMILVYVMLAYLDWNVYGLVIGNVTFALVVCILNWFSIKRALRYRQEILTTFLLPLLASFFMGGAALGIYYGTFSLTQKNSISMLVTVPFAMMVYAVLILLLRVVTEEELPQMPFGRKILILSKKLRLL
ncbi:polysaccharide biosynthesis protein [bacterium D16-54]|nr:polysaccharide biosynthesis protein [bacterium D16-54]RKJ15696.1 polysaccharide biosynthesis protein [bacterium D16-56]